MEGGSRVSAIWVSTLIMALAVGGTLAQSISKPAPVSAACVELYYAAMTQIANGRLNMAELAVSAALAVGADHAHECCAGLVLNNMAAFMSVSGRPADAERLAERAVLILEKTYSQNGLELLRPLQTLAASRLERGETTKAR